MGPTLRLPLGCTRPRAITLTFCALRGVQLGFPGYVYCLDLGAHLEWLQRLTLVAASTSVTPSPAPAARSYNTVHRTVGGIGDPESLICLTFVHDIRCNSKISGDLCPDHNDVHPRQNHRH